MDGPEEIAVETPQAPQIDDSIDGGIDHNDVSIEEPPPESKTAAEESAEVTEEKEGQPESDETQSAPPEKSAIGEGLLARAVELGFTQDEARMFQTPAALTVALKRVESLMEKAPAKEPAKDSQPAPEAEGKLEPLSAEEYDEGVAKWSKTATDTIHRLEAEMASMRQERSAEQLQTTVAAFDRGVADLGEEYHDVLGKGNVNEIDRNSEAYGNRGRLIKRMNSLEQEYAQSGTKKDLNEILREAATSLFPDKIRTQTKREIKSGLDRMKGASLAKPGNRTTQAKPGREKAAAYAENWFKEHGAELGASEDPDGI